MNFREGTRLIIEPTHPRSLLSLLSTLSPIAEEFPVIDELDLDPKTIWKSHLL